MTGTPLTRQKPAESRWLLPPSPEGEGHCRLAELRHNWQLGTPSSVELLAPVRLGSAYRRDVREAVPYGEMRKRKLVQAGE